ncbi:peptidoglycan-binding domain-containing protein [Microbacterium sp.]|uniref:peptidoglycan-binding domain-containing protein n=1 Tax=Microbacterium sp. TaxID=51671 RepID=UPI003A8DD4E6
MSKYNKIMGAVAGAFLVALGVIAAAVPASAMSPAPASSATVLAAAACNTSTQFELYANPNEEARVPTYGTSKNCTLRSGNISEGVRTLQNSLNLCHGKSLVVDGNFGPATRTALIQVQAAIGVTADGIYGTQTYTKMRHKNSINYSCSVGSAISNTIW